MSEESLTAVAEQVRIALSEVLERELPEIAPDERLFEDLMLDSTSIIELLMLLEDAMALDIDPDELDPAAFETFGTLVSYIAGLPTHA